MGTKLQYKSYFPTYNPMRDLNEDTEICWSQYYEDKTLSGNLYNGFALRLVNGYSEYDKEMLKRTMLEHEAIFKKQVYELHRLYRIQKNLMDDFQKKGIYRYSILADSSQSNSFSSRMASEGTERIWQMTHLPVVSTSYYMAPVASTDDMKSPLDFLKESSVQSIRFPNENGAPLKDNSLQESKLKRFPGRTFDLHLPADVYTDREGIGKQEKEIFSEPLFRSTVNTNKIYGADRENDVKLTLGTGECCSHQEDSWKTDPHKQNGLQAHILVNLNEPIEEICCEFASGSASTHFLGPRTHREEDQGHCLPTSSNTSFLGLQSTLFKDRQDGSCSIFPYADKDEVRQEWPSYYGKAGETRNNVSFFCSGPRNEILSRSSEPIQLKPTRTREEIPVSNQTDTWFKQKPTLGIEISEGTPLLASSNISGPTLRGSPGSFSVLTQPVNSISRISNAVKALPCFNGSATQDTSNACGKWRLNGDSRPHPRLGSEVPTYPNGFHRHSLLDSNSPIFGESNLDSKGDGSAFGNSEGHGHQKCFNGLQHTDLNTNQAVLNEIGDGNCRALPGGFSWLARKPACNESVDLNKYASQMELSFSHGHRWPMPSSSAVDPESEWKQEKEKGLSVSDLHDFPSTSQVEREPYDSMTGNTVLGFPIPDKIQKNATSSPSYQERSVTDDDDTGRENHGSLSYGKLSSDINAPSFEEQNLVGGPVRANSTRFSNHINLNTMCMDDPNSPEDEVDEVPSPVSVPILAVEVASEIDLEGSITSQLENSFPREESAPSIEPDVSQETEFREAAENIVMMSSAKRSHFDGDTLKWFAEIATSNSERARLSRGGTDDGLDLFELMTLNLEEIKSDEHRFRPQDPEYHNDEEKGSAPLLLTRPRRGQARRRRQQRDFQKDILPGLASLSRHEVAEDLQTIGGLMRASGWSWQTGPTRRNLGRNGLHSPASGRRRRPRSLAIAVEEIQVSPRPTKTTDAEFEVDGRTVIGWGRTTRRCRRPRCPPPVNVSSPLT